MKRLIPLLAAIAAFASIAAQRPPLYIVNGVATGRIDSIPPADIERVDLLPADDETIASYGEQASSGVLVVTLRYDAPARFSAAESFGSYIARQVAWDEDEEAARVVLRYKVTPEGRAEVTEELESTDKRLRRRVLKAVAEAPGWEPARKEGRAVESEGVLRIQLPEGKPLPRPVELVIR